MQPSADLVLGHRYTLVELVAVGGMGEVWKARDEVLHRTVAVKVLKSALLDSPEFVERFRGEARHAAALAHVGIAAVYDYGEDETGAFLVMELVAGRPLSQLLAERPIPPLITTLSILAQTAEALDAAHRGGVVHRDVKPGNILVLPDGAVKVTDFGIARAIDVAAHGTNPVDTRIGPLTVVGQVVGTPQYMSPEQVAGEHVTAATDVYSLGVIGYEMLAGQRPFLGDSALALALAHARDVPPPLPHDVPAGVRELIARTLSKRIEDRPVSAAAFATELRMLQMTLTPAPLAVASATPTGAHGTYSAGPGAVVPAAVLSAPVMSATAMSKTTLNAAPVSIEGSTAVMPAGGLAVGAPLVVVEPSALEDESAGRRRQRRRIMLTSVAALISIGVVALLVRQDDSPSMSLDAVVAATSSPPETTVAPQAVSLLPILVDPNAYIGRPAADVVAELQALGLVVDTQNSASDRPAGTVVDVTPSGSLSPGSPVTVAVSTGDEDGDEEDKGGGKGGDKSGDNGKGKG